MQTAGLVTIILVVIAVLVIFWLVFQVQGVQHFKRLDEGAPKKKTDELRAEAQSKEQAPSPATGSSSESALAYAAEAQHDPSADSVDARIDAAQANARKNAQSTRPKVIVLSAPTVWDLLTPKEDTMREYGVTQAELDELVAQYRRDHAYDVEAAPRTLTFNVDKWEDAMGSMQDSMANSVVERRYYEDGLVDALYKEGEL